MVDETERTDSVQHCSHQQTLVRFDSPVVAAKYPAEYGNSLREQREKRCLVQALDQVAPGSAVLDLPCGTGRLTRLLVKAGMDVTGADGSLHMIELAKKNWQALRTNRSELDRDVCFEVRDVMKTGYANREFDAVFCNRLFHHFHESMTRIAALTELRRISRGPVVVSFFNSFALDAVKFRLKHLLRGTVPTDRIPISLRTFADDVRTAGLEITSTLPVLWGLSPMWYLIARPKLGIAASALSRSLTPTVATMNSHGLCGGSQQPWAA